MAASSDKSETNINKDSDAQIDAELNDLLNDALEDFGDGNEASPAQSTASKSENNATSKEGADSISDLFTEEFSDEMAKQFEDAMKNLMSDDPTMMKQIEKLADAAGSAGESEKEQQDFQSTLKETLDSLAQNTENLQDGAAAGGGGDPTGMMSDDMMKMFENMSMGGSGLQSVGPDEGFMPMMQGMMKTLLSKEVLYPSLKDIADKYPDWLKENKDKVPDKDYSNYSKQHEIIADILKDFEAEQASDTDDVKNTRHERIMDKMQKMQDLGQPPKEIVGEMAPGLDFDPNGVPKFPGSPDACSLM